MRRGPALRRALCGLILSLSLVAAPVARACSIALVLAVDVSGSVDEYEYQLQVQGIANALRDAHINATEINNVVGQLDDVFRTVTTGGG